MDELIGLIIQGIIALLSGGKNKNAPPPMRPAPQQRPPTGPPQPAQPGFGRTAQGQRRMAPQGRPQPMSQRKSQALATRRAAAQRRAVAPPPLPQAPQPVAAAPPRAAAPAAAPSRSPAITGAAIRQLVRSRPAAMRTIYVLTEVVGKPLGLQDF